VMNRVCHARGSIAVVPSVVLCTRQA
jgi:hypothetical protein